MSSPQLYFLAGLGFDQRIFHDLKIDKGEVNYLNWFEPNKNESLDSYVKRMAEQIVPTDNPIILIGHSFGGIVVQELSKLITVEKVIIISSIKSKSEIPPVLKILKSIPLYKLLNKQLILKSFPIWAKPFGYKTQKGRELFIDMIGRCSSRYCRWSMDKIVNWNGNPQAKDVIHLHGSNDMTFPIRLIKKPISIDGGSHFLVYSKAEEVSEVLNGILT